MTATYPHVRFFGLAATAFSSATSPASAWIGCVYMNKDTPANRKRAEQDLRKMFPANEARLIAERTGR